MKGTGTASESKGDKGTLAIVPRLFPSHRKKSSLQNLPRSPPGSHGNFDPAFPRGKPAKRHVSEGGTHASTRSSVTGNTSVGKSTVDRSWVSNGAIGNSLEGNNISTRSIQDNRTIDKGKRASYQAIIHDRASDGRFWPLMREEEARREVKGYKEAEKDIKDYKPLVYDEKPRVLLSSSEPWYEVYRGTGMMESHDIPTSHESLDKIASPLIIREREEEEEIKELEIRLY
jgi:hypothetical protein